MQIAAFVLSIVALVVSGALTIVQLKRGRATERRKLFLELHQSMMNPQHQRGRRIAYGLRSEQDALALANTLEDWELTNGALAAFDVLALFAEKDYIDADLVLEQWRDQLRLINSNGVHFIQTRQFSDGRLPWPHLRALAAKA